MNIEVLSPEVASRIAAGEVVERPASVVKELVENALDAGATRINVEVRGGGIEMIRVTDNGQGIPSSQVELAFQRYATSKIREVKDLERISTLGFRGEALPSIAAVADVSMLTREAREGMGVRVEVRGGRVVKRGGAGCAPGTTVTVHRLFRSLPARLKFLKGAAAEAGRIQHLVSQYALAFPEVAFALFIEGRPTLTSPGQGDLRGTVAAVYEPEVAQALLEVRGREEGGVEVWGLVSPPSLTRANRSYISFFVNRRWVQSRLLTYALEQAYQGFLPEGRHPLAVVHLQVPYEDVDVNVHPAKLEVRFRHEGAVFAALQKAVRHTLVTLAPVPPIHTQRLAFPGERTPAGPAPQRGLTEPGTTTTPSSQPSAPLVPRAALPVLRVLGQLQGTYIVAEGPDGMYLIDQHAAHERVLFEQLKAQVARGQPEVQGLLEPVTLELTPQQEAVVQEKASLLKRYGLELEPFGRRAYLLRSVPGLFKGDARAAVQDVLDLLLQERDLQEWEEKLAASIACRSAVRAGMNLSLAEMEELMRQLEVASQPHTCPHGRPTTIHFSAALLEREFGRA